MATTASTMDATKAPQRTGPVLAAIGDPAHAPEVLKAAVRFAELFHSSLVLCKVIAPQPVPMSPDGFLISGDLAPPVDHAADQELQMLARSLPEGVKTESMTVIDIPWQGICEAAKRVHASLIVLGPHEYHGLDVLLGTTAAKVVNHTDRSVIVVRGDLPS